MTEVERILLQSLKEFEDLYLTKFKEQEKRIKALEDVVEKFLSDYEKRFGIVMSSYNEVTNNYKIVQETLTKVSKKLTERW